MNNAVPEVGCEDLAKLGLSGREKNRARRKIGLSFELLLKLEDIFFGINLELQRIYCIALVPAACEITPINIPVREYAVL